MVIIIHGMVIIMKTRENKKDKVKFAGGLKETQGEVRENWSWGGLGLRVFHQKVLEDLFSEELEVSGA
jgi:hypothetical protein